MQQSAASEKRPETSLLNVLKKFIRLLRIINRKRLFKTKENCFDTTSRKKKARTWIHVSPGNLFALKARSRIHERYEIFIREINICDSAQRIFEPRHQEVLINERRRREHFYLRCVVIAFRAFQIAEHGTAETRKLNWILQALEEIESTWIKFAIVQ